MTRKSIAVLVALGLFAATASGYTVAKLSPEQPSGPENAAHDDAENGLRADAGGHDHEESRSGSTRSEPAEEHGAGEIRLTPDQIALAEIKAVPVTTDAIDITLSVTGEVTANQDRLVEVVPLVPGIVRDVRALLGTRVKKGDVMAVIDSRELADAKSAWVAARERTKLAQAKFERDERLWKKKIVSEQDYLDARTALAEARIEQRAAEHKLRALGLTGNDLRALADHSDQSFTHFEVTAPMDGTVIAKHVTVGESVDASRPVYRLADLSTVWVIASVYEKDFSRIRKGQHAVVSARAYPGRTFDGLLTWVSDTIDERTRTLKVRIEVDNAERQLKPGMFITAGIAVDRRDGVVTVPADAIRRGKGEEVVFIAEGDGRFEWREVRTGARTGDRVEIVRGVKPGERVVTEGSLILKSELEKGGFEAGHGH